MSPAISITVLAVIVVTTTPLIAWLVAKPRPTRARLEVDGYQEVEIRVKGRYVPDVIEVRRGIPARLIFRRLEENPCSDTVIFSNPQLTVRLPAYQATPVCFVPTRCGEFLFTCAMGMYRGTMAVVEPKKREEIMIATELSKAQELNRSSVSHFPLGPVVAGFAAALLLTGAYVAVVGLVQSFDHALELLRGDWYFALPLAAGFGVQVGLFVYVRTRLRLARSTRSATALAGTGTGTSTVSMIACCAHHLTDVLPILGLSGAALLLDTYRGPLLGLGLLSNLVGIAILIRMIRHQHRLWRTKVPSRLAANLKG